MAEGFFDRWSRKKREAGAEKPVREADVAQQIPPVALEAESLHPGLPPVVEGGSQAKEEGAAPERAPPSLADAQALGIDSDFRPFLAKNVAPEVKNAAFKKLFADPHFNVMDGLDTYVEDYSQPSPLPLSVLRQMASAKFLNLFDEEPEKVPEKVPEKPPGTDALPDVAQSGTPTDRDIPSQPVADAQPASHTTDDDHADLRLQPDDAARAEDARRGTG
jgi:Protein of unknown function (DUF3306)